MRFSFTGVPRSRLLVSALFLALAAGCGGDRDSGAVAAIDDLSMPLELSSAVLPSRIASLDPALTEILFALGLGGSVVGRTTWDLWSDSVSRVPDLGNGIAPNIEAIIGVRPDLALLYATEANREAATRLRAAGIPVAAWRIDRIADFRRVTLEIGRMTGSTERAHAVVDSVTATLDRVRMMTRGGRSINVFLHSWENPLITIGGGSFITELIEIAGARNVFGDLPGPSPQVAFEEVVRRNPDAILGGPVTARQLGAIPRWRSLAAVREGRILVFDTLLVARPSVRLGEAALSLARLFANSVQ
ncbi:MAG: ABC transporter substrate-binding protein [Gemmatimonadota bacterium]